MADNWGVRERLTWSPALLSQLTNRSRRSRKDLMESRCQFAQIWLLVFSGNAPHQCQYWRVSSCPKDLRWDESKGQSNGAD
jgi:hypothetical protein